MLKKNKLGETLVWLMDLQPKHEEVITDQTFGVQALK